MIERNIELLAPAGSYRAFEAALGAGADAVYVGGPAFGARAYAQNFTMEELIAAIRTAHIHNRRLYLTVNTLLKNKELYEQLFPVLLPCYEEGLDAVIVQDMGVFSFIRRNFPEMHIHASTQMNITGPLGMKFLEEQGAARIVAARELSLQELALMHRTSPIEIEAFIHGALCYSYSGQCLMSSMLGGRSGNRGRCAQPCRLSYQAGEKSGLHGSSGFSGKKEKNGKRTAARGREFCPLSLKDICTLDILPEILRSGVTSLKIEGRMKQLEYTAGVTAIYRKYLDLFLQNEEAYHVEEADRKQLLDLFNRGGSCTGYYKQHNGPSMMAFANEKKTGGGSGILKKAREPLKGILHLSPGAPARLELSCRDISVSAAAGEVQTAKERPMTVERIRSQMEKLGNTEFVWDTLEIRINGEVFLPVSLLNELRRRAISEMEDALCRSARRKRIPETPLFLENVDCRVPKKNGGSRIPLFVSCETEEQAEAALNHRDVQGLYLNYDVLDTLHIEEISARRDLYLALPHITRGPLPSGYEEKCRQWVSAGLRGFLVRNLESYGWLKSLGYSHLAVTDASLYIWNNEAKAFWVEEGILKDTVPLELNEKEISHRDNRRSEMLIYGFAPLMLSAQCVRKNLLRCDKSCGRMYLRDRYQAEFTSVCVCNPWKTGNTGKRDFCYNILYNSIPTGLLREATRVKALGAKSLRMAFTIESGRETARLLDEYTGVYYYGRKPAEHSFTGGHFKRGAE